MRTTRSFGLTLIAVVGLLIAGGSARAQGPTDGKVTIQSTSIALGVGVTWGDGVLEYGGKKYTFTVKGLTLVDLGVSKVFARGDVFELKNVEDFDGKYIGGGGGATLGVGAGGAAMVNEKGVRMVLTANTEGVKLSIAQAGVEIAINK